MPTNEVNPIGQGGGSNVRLYAILVAIVVIVGIVTLAWVMSDDNDDADAQLPYVFPSLEPSEPEFSMRLPEEVRFHLAFEGQHFFAENFTLLENCSIAMENWWTWEEEDNKYGYRHYNNQMFLIGPTQIFDLYASVFDAEEVLNPGTPTSTAQPEQ